MEIVAPDLQQQTDKPLVGLDAIQGVAGFSRPSSGRDAPAGHSGRSTADDDDAWLQAQLTFDQNQNGRHLPTDLLEPPTGAVPTLYGHSGLTSSRFDNTLPLFNAHALHPSHGAPLDNQNWARLYSEKADQATATSPLRRPARRDSSSGFLFAGLDMGSSEGCKAPQEGGLPFGELEEPSLSALHHLHQVHQGFSMPAGQLMGLDDPLQTHPQDPQGPLNSYRQVSRDSSFQLFGLNDHHLSGVQNPRRRSVSRGASFQWFGVDDQNVGQSHEPGLRSRRPVSRGTSFLLFHPHQPHFGDHPFDHQMLEGDHTALHLLQPSSLGREASDAPLHWQTPEGPHQAPLHPPPCFPSSAAMQSALQHAFAAAENNSDQQSDDSAALYTSSTGYSHSPPLSPRTKRPCGPRSIAAVNTTTSHRKKQDLAGTSGGKSWLDSPAGADTPDNQREFPARAKREDEDVRERAASELYGLRRLRASPRWAIEAAQMSDDSRSADEAEAAESGSDTEALSWARRPGPASRACTRRRRRVRTSTGDASCSSQFRGVSKHRLTQRWEASLWLEGRQLYLGGFQTELDAARAYDIAALSCKGPHVLTNYPEEAYAQELQETAGCSTALRKTAATAAAAAAAVVKAITADASSLAVQEGSTSMYRAVSAGCCNVSLLDEMIAYVRRKSAAFSRGRSKYRGVSGQAGRWEARIGAYCGRKNVSFGVHEDEESAARQYDRALLIEKGRAAKTNFPLPDYEKEAKEFEDLVIERCGDVTCEAAADMMGKWVLPLAANTANGGPQPIIPKKKGRGGRPRSHAACIILAEDLRKAIKRT